MAFHLSDPTLFYCLLLMVVAHMQEATNGDLTKGERGVLRKRWYTRLARNHDQQAVFGARATELTWASLTATAPKLEG